MANWIELTKKLLVSSSKRHILVADQDHLFEYPELHHAFQEDGFQVIQAKTGLDVRIHFELQVRESGNNFLIIAPGNYQPLPDIEEWVNFQTLSLSRLFPNLDPKAIKGLSYNGLCTLSGIKLYEELGHDKTLKFLLENLYNVDFDNLDMNRNREKMLNTLISVYIEKDDVNPPLAKFLANMTRSHFLELVSVGLNKNSLLSFIDQQWSLFVVEKKSLIDFNDSVLSKNMGYLFAFGLLKPVRLTSEQYQSFSGSLKIGIFTDEAENHDCELEGLTEHLEQQLQMIEDIPDQWFILIQVLSQARLNFFISGNGGLREKYLKVENAINVRFQRFIENTYGSLFSLSGVRKPVVVSRILEHIRSNPSDKKALMVIDGMNYWQWQLLGKALKDNGILFIQNASLAYLPTITAWSRQAIFKGDKPDLSENNTREAKLFEIFWKHHNMLDFQINFIRFGINEPLLTDSIPDDICMLGLLCNDLDDIMHGSILGNEQLVASTGQWIEKSGIVSIIYGLLKRGFQIFVTSDHGNIEASGIRNLALHEKAWTLGRGKRHLHFANETMLQLFLDANQELVVGKRGLSIYLKHNEAFTDSNNKVITHGGSHIWEIIVPFIHIYEK